MVAAGFKALVVIHIPDPIRLVRTVNKAEWLERTTRDGLDPQGLARG
jgi:hypothetical protein